MLFTRLCGLFRGGKIGFVENKVVAKFCFAVLVLVSSFLGLDLEEA